MRLTRRRAHVAVSCVWTLGQLLLAAAVIVAFWNLGIGRANADPDALWTIVHDRCVPDQGGAR
jgi:CDP-diacylglycerol pyrophosphatase